MTNEQAHRIACEQGISRPLYLLARVLLTPMFRVWWWMRSCRAERVPAKGAAIVAPNHKSGWDPFLVAACAGRPMRFMAKAELFDGPLARPLLRLGAFPVRRGASDMAAIDTAREILRRGELLLLFPEGRIVRDADGLGMPRRGVGRLALETGAPIVPTAITGSDRLFAGPFLRPTRVRVAFGRPVDVGDMAATPEAAGELVEGMVWPEVEQEFRYLRSLRQRRRNGSGSIA